MTGPLYRIMAFHGRRKQWLLHLRECPQKNLLSTIRGLLAAGWTRDAIRVERLDRP